MLENPIEGYTYHLDSGRQKSERIVESGRVAKMLCAQLLLKMFGLAAFEAIEVKRLSMLNLEVTTSKICNRFRKFGCQPRKGKAVFCMTNGSKVLIYLSFLLFLNDLLL